MKILGTFNKVKRVDGLVGNPKYLIKTSENNITFTIFLLVIHYYL